MTKAKKKRLLNIIVPVFNESDSISEFFRRTKSVIENLKTPDWTVALVFVNDGSTDSTFAQLNEIARSQTKVKVYIINLSRNFGHQQAVWAGIENSESNACILVMDADLQDPPEMIPSFLAGLEQNDVVLARRISRSDSIAKKFFAKYFYAILENLSGGTMRPNIGDFWALSERAKIALLQYGEELKYLRGLVSELGFSLKIIDYDRDSRYAGQTHYSVFKMIQLAIAGITGFTIKPLIYTVYVAIGISMLLIPASIFLAWSRFAGESMISPGLTYVGITLILSISLLFVVLSILALYIARIAIEVKKRPVYILDSVILTGKKKM
jgi:glycosyltransferase involved in cell wall biosynthesis